MRNEQFRRRLQQELITRTEENPKFSARAFARQLEVDPSSFIQIINGKRALTDKMCMRLAQKLDLSPGEVEGLMGIRTEDNKERAFDHFSRISMDSFKVMSDWYHYAILELTHLKHFKGDVKWISKVLGITVHEARSAVERLQRLDFLIIEDGKWIDNLGDANNLGNEFTAPAARKLQKQILLKAIDALENTPYEKRVQSSMTLPVPQSRVKEAKEKILLFFDELDAFLRQGTKHDEIYNVSFSLYPISKTIQEKNK